MKKNTTAEDIESRVQGALESSIRERSLLKEYGVEDMDAPTPEEMERMRRERYRIEQVYAHQRDRDVQREDERNLDRWSRMERIRREEAMLNMAWTVRYHTLSRTRGRLMLERRATNAEGYDEDGQKWQMVGLYIEDQQSDFERSLGLDPEAERDLERAVVAAREESDDPRAYDPLQDERFRQRILNYECVLGDRAFVLLKRLDRDFDNAYHQGEITLTDDVPQYLFWTTPLWSPEDIDGRYVFTDIPPASLTG